MHGLVGLTVGNVPLANVVEVGRGINPAVIWPTLVEKVRIWVSRVTEASSSFSSIEPALIAVAARGVTGQSVTAGVARVLSLTLQRSRQQQSEAKNATHQVTLCDCEWSLTLECLFGESFPGTSCLSLLCPPPPPGARNEDTGTCQRGSCQKTHTQTLAGLKQITPNLHAWPRGLNTYSTYKHWLPLTHKRTKSHSAMGTRLCKALIFHQHRNTEWSTWLNNVKPAITDLFGQAETGCNTKLTTF